MKIHKPSLFIAGVQDSVVAMIGRVIENGEEAILFDQGDSIPGNYRDLAI